MGDGATALFTFACRTTAIIPVAMAIALLLPLEHRRD